LRPTEVAKLLGWSKNTVYGLIRTGQLDVIHVGKRLWVPNVALRRFLQLPAAS
jgi:excisionase family DNA binding protein